MNSQVNYERRESFAVIRLNRPDKLNAISREMIAELSELFSKAADDRELRAIILTAVGERAFSAGTDLSQLVDVDANDARSVANRGQALCNQIDNSPVPVIAAVNGIAAGAGCELALACHLRIGSSNSSFSLPETKLGIVPGYGGTQRLTREIGRGRALEIMLTARTVRAEEALTIGLLNRMTTGSELLTAAESLANEIAQLAPLAIRSCLEAVTRGADMQLEKALDLEAQLFARLFATEDMREGTRAFLEKRAPNFRGE
ncbi:MAG TPA: enoyl-CoA hydratase-related protein [Pyrinomonadaceae bacterium]|nr:enoyl-CoA hydratase-related protein [Pyrinomonadaceae bacterium]